MVFVEFWGVWWLCSESQTSMSLWQNAWLAWKDGLCIPVVEVSAHHDRESSSSQKSQGLYWRCSPFLFYSMWTSSLWDGAAVIHGQSSPSYWTLSGNFPLDTTRPVSHSSPRCFSVQSSWVTRLTVARLFFSFSFETLTGVGCVWSLVAFVTSHSRVGLRAFRALSLFISPGQSQSHRKHSWRIWEVKRNRGLWRSRRAPSRNWAPRFASGSR